MVDRQIATSMYEEGYALAEIGRQFSVTKQRVWQILKPFYLELDKSKRRPSNNLSPISRPEQLFIIQELKRRRISVIPQGYTSLFNILIGDKKVSIRYRTNPTRRDDYEYFRFDNLSAKVEMDFYILLAGQIPLSTIYIIPKERIRRSISIPTNPVGKIAKKWRQYKEAWHLLTPTP